MQKRSRMPRDVNQLAKLVGDRATGQAPAEEPDDSKNPAAVALSVWSVTAGRARVRASYTHKMRHELFSVCVMSV